MPKTALGLLDDVNGQHAVDLLCLDCAHGEVVQSALLGSCAVSCCCPPTEAGSPPLCARRTAPLVVGLAGGLTLIAAAFAAFWGLHLWSLNVS